MLYHIPRVSLRPLALVSTITRRVLKAESTSSPAQLAAKRIFYVASQRSYGSTVSKPRAAPKPTTATKATQTRAARLVGRPPKTATKAKKPVKKATKAKKKAAPKKPVKKPAKKKAPSEAAKARAEREKVKALKKTALLDQPSKRNNPPWLTYVAELRANADLSSNIEGSLLARNAALMAEASKNFKSLPSAEIERLNHITNQKNEEANAAYKKWLLSHTPKQILEANKARNALRRMETEKNAAAGKKATTRKYPRIEDDRVPKHFMTPYMIFSKERWSTGDFKSLDALAGAKLLSEEWKALSEDAKKLYVEKSNTDRLRFESEEQTVFQ